MKEDIYFTAPHNNRKVKVGTLVQLADGIAFIKKVTRSRHFMRVIQGYGIQKQVFDNHLRGKKGYIFIIEDDTGKKLRASIKNWTNNSSTQNYGDGKQIFLSEKFMEKEDNNNLIV